MKKIGLMMSGISGLFFAFCWFITSLVDWSNTEPGGIGVSITAAFIIISLALFISGIGIFIYGIIAPYINPF